MSVHDQVVQIIDKSSSVKASVSTRGSKGAVAVELLDQNGNQVSFSASLVTEPYDYISLSGYDANNNPSTIVYKLGGASGTTVATLTLAYSGSNIISVTKT